MQLAATDCRFFDMRLSYGLAAPLRRVLYVTKVFSLEAKSVAGGLGLSARSSAQRRGHPGTRKPPQACGGFEWDEAQAVRCTLSDLMHFVHTFRRFGVPLTKARTR